jgi:hypothetical protein
MKFKYKKIFLSCTLVCTLLLSSCADFLKEDPVDRKTNIGFWKSESDALRGINTLYNSGVPALHNTNIWGGWSPTATMYGGLVSGLFVDTRRDRDFTNNAEQATFNIQGFDREAQELWMLFYQGVARANTAIINIPNMTHLMSEEKINGYVAQAKFFRAYNYFFLVKEFGDVPYIDFIYESASNTAVARTPSSEIYGHIERDLLEAIPLLPNAAFYDNGGRVTRPMAQTLLAQAYLQWAGYPVNGGNAVYAKAAAMAQQVISGGQHALIDAAGTTAGLNSAFNTIKTTKSSNEIIFAREYSQALNMGNGQYASKSIENAALNASLGFLRPGGDVLYNAYLPADMLTSAYHPDDIRGMEKQFFFRYLDYIPQRGGNEGIPQVMTMSNWGNWAWYDETALRTGQSGSLNMPNMRYAEVLLIAAEALARTGDAAAAGYLNQVRVRAGLAPVTATGDALVQAILSERFFEMPLEFRIWDDIRRTRLYPQAVGAGSGEFNWVPLAQSYIQNKPQGTPRLNAIPEFALLWPMSLREMQANPLLVQNPGWR